MPLGGCISIAPTPSVPHLRGRRSPDQGLSSLGDTLAKLSQDKDRTAKLLETLAGKIKLEQGYTKHTRKQFAESGYIIVKELGQGRFGSIKLAKKEDK